MKNVKQPEQCFRSYVSETQHDVASATYWWLFETKRDVDSPTTILPPAVDGPIEVDNINVSNFGDLHRVTRASKTPAELKSASTDFKQHVTWSITKGNPGRINGSTSVATEPGLNIRPLLEVLADRVWRRKGSHREWSI